MRHGGRWAVAVCVLMAGCGDDGSASTSNELLPADEVIAAGELGELDELPLTDLGEVADFGDGVTLIIQSVEVGGDSLGPWLEVTARAENRGGEDATNPSLELVCAGSADGGGWQAESTYRLSNDLPTGTFSEGVVHLLIPGDGRFGEPVPVCAGTARLHLTGGGFVIAFGDDEPPAYTLELPEDVLAELNQAAADFNSPS